jgi:zinc D-Ala-D-Ala carboxypeptidase
MTQKEYIMLLSRNFTLAELTDTDTGIANNPSQEEIRNLKLLVQKVLQPVRDKFGVINVTSGYRSPGVNSAVGGSATSDHVHGRAADIQCEDMATVFKYIRKNLPFKQLIWEFGTDAQPKWIHVAYDANNNKGEVLKAIKKGGKTKYVQF